MSESPTVFLQMVDAIKQRGSHSDAGAIATMAMHEIARLDAELAKANASVLAVVRNGDKLIDELSGAWESRDVLRGENDRLAATVRDLMSRHQGAHDECECKVCAARGRHIDAVAKELIAGGYTGWSTGMAPIVKQLIADRDAAVAAVKA